MWGEDLNQTNKYNNTALLIGVKNMSFESIQLLVNYGANYKHINQFGLDCQKLAQFKGFKALVDYFNDIEK